MSEYQKTDKWIIDCDPGIDDMTAIFYLTSRPNTEILLISTVNGNVSLDQVTNNSKKIIKWMNSSIPILRGASIPILDNEKSADNFHCEDGLGGIEELMNFCADDIEIGEEKSYFKMIELAVKYPGEINLLILGPLTNIAMAYTIYPGINSLFKSIYMMGGCAFSKGNITPTAEFNYYLDYVATKIVLTNFKNIIIVPWEPTEDVKYTTSDMEQIKKKLEQDGNKQGKIFEAVQMIVEKYTEKVAGLNFCDLYSIMPAYNRKTVMNFVMAKIDIAIESHRNNGMCIITERKIFRKDFNSFMAEDWDSYKDDNYHIIVERLNREEVDKEYESIFANFKL
jgi:inosine-uridine nucleoside N-ribohydrolase